MGIWPFWQPALILYSIVMFLYKYFDFGKIKMPAYYILSISCYSCLHLISLNDDTMTASAR